MGNVAVASWQHHGANVGEFFLQHNLCCKKNLPATQPLLQFLETGAVGMLLQKASFATQMLSRSPRMTCQVLCNMDVVEKAPLQHDPCCKKPTWLLCKAKNHLSYRCPCSPPPFATQSLQRSAQRLIEGAHTRAPNHRMGMCRTTRACTERGARLATADAGR